MKDKNPLDIQQKGITPISTTLRPATGIVTMYTVDVVEVWVWLTIIAPYCAKIHAVTTYFYHCNRVTSNQVTDCEPGLSSMYGDVPLTFSQSCDRRHQTQ